MSVDEVTTNRQSVAVVVADEVAPTVLRVDEDSLVDRPGVAGAVLQTAS